MTKTPHNTPITGEMVLLGTGTSVGVPSIGCGCDVCMKLRSLIKAAKPDNNNTAVSKSAIFVCFDGGFVIGKQQQILQEQQDPATPTPAAGAAEATEKARRGRSSGTEPVL